MLSPTPSRIAIYACVSAASTAWSQLMELRAWCRQNRHVVVGTYIDHESDGVDRRPGRTRLLADAARKNFDKVLVWSLDCFNAKGVGQTAVDIQRLLQHGVAFHSFTEDHLCTDDGQAHHVLLPVIFSFANLEREKLSKRIKAGLRRARAKGKRLGRAPFSYDQLQGLQSALDTGANWYRVSRTTGIPYSTVKKWARELGREPPGRGAF
jgi:DNA invertase Pin-like site-specific DNA recombinase